jgi:hypothetical protein
VHLVPAAELPGDGVEAKADGLTQEVPELVYLSLVLPIYGEVALSAPFMGRWPGGPEGIRRRGQAGGAGRLEHLDCDGGGLLDGRPVGNAVFSVPVLDRRCFRGFAARAAAAALGAA